MRDSDADVVAFYPYLYYPTVVGMEAAPAPRRAAPGRPRRARPVPAVFDATFADADAICYHTAAERRLVQRRPPGRPDPPDRARAGGRAGRRRGAAGGEILGIGDRPYLVSVGRVDEHKGSSMLAAFFRTYKKRHPGPLALALVGPVAASIADHEDIVLTGAVSEADKWDLVRDATVSISPSALESFSLVVLEAWEQSVPVMVNATCDPTREHCERSGGGLWFGSYREFEVVLERLCADAGLRTLLGTRGHAYVRALLPVARPDPSLRPVPHRRAPALRRPAPRAERSEPGHPHHGLGQGGCPPVEP